MDDVQTIIENLGADAHRFSGKTILLTDRSGLVRSVELETGQPTGEEFQLTGSHAYASAAISITEKLILVPLADGTVVLGELKVRKEEPPKKLPETKEADPQKDKAKK